MRISSAQYRDGLLYVIIDGHELWTQTKYTILELGYALYLFAGDPDDDLIRRWGETIPADPEDGRSELRSEGCLITSDPILFTLAYEHWKLAAAGELIDRHPVAIPLLGEAFEIMRTREIANEHHLKWAGTMPPRYADLLRELRSSERLANQEQILDLVRRFHHGTAIQDFIPYQPNAGLGPQQDDPGLRGRLERAAINQAVDGKAAESRYAIWAETVRGILQGVHDDIAAGRSVGRKARLRQCINSLAAFSEIQRLLDPFENELT